MSIKHKDLPGTYVHMPDGRNIKITAHNGESHNKSLHQYYCENCAKDPEMFGDGHFWVRYHDLKKGIYSCGCATSPRWSRHQYHIRSKRSAIASGLIYYGFSEEFKGWNTKLNVWCRHHGPLKSATPTSLCVIGRGCRKCYDLRISDRAPNDQEAMDKYLDRCGYPEGTTLRRLDKRDKGGTRRFFALSCSACLSDEYTKAGICSGIFETTIEALCSSEKSCRCGTTYCPPENIASHQAESLLRGSGIDFLGWKSGYKNHRSKAIASCADHGIFFPTLGTLKRGSRCPACSHGGYSVNKPGYIYLLLSGCGKMMKVGITNDPKKRMEDLRRFTPFDFTVLDIKSTTGEAAPAVESAILKSVKRMGRKGFNGASEWFEYNQSARDIISKI